MRVKYLIFLMGAIAPLMLCEVRSTQAQNLIEPVIKASPQPATTVNEWLRQIAQASIAQITAVELNPTTTGVEVTLETVGQLEPTTSVMGDALIIDIPNAVLTTDEEFQAANPVEGIALVTATNLPNNRVRVEITGTTAPPTAEVRAIEGASVLNVAASVADEDELEIIVTGEQEDDSYFVPDASTATRTDTPTLDVPASIQVIPQRVLEDQQVTDVVDALGNVSGVSVDSDRGVVTEINIRGFNRAPVLLDGFRLFGDTTPQETANLERIEVLRGPASILFGEIQPGGFVNLVTERPTAEPFYDIQLQVGSFGLIRPEIDVSGPLTDDRRLLYRLNAVYNREDGFRDFDTDYERFFLAPVVTWQISDRTDLTISLEFLDEEQPFDAGLIAFVDGGVADIPFDRVINEPDDFNQRVFLNVGYNLEHRFSDNWRLRNAFRYTEQNYSSEVAIPVAFDESTGIATRFYGAQAQDTSTYALQTNVVGEFATGAINHTLLVGTDLSLSLAQRNTTGDFNTPIPLDVFNPEYGILPRPDREEFDFLFGEDTETKRLGIYLQDQIAFGDNLILLAGLRYDTVDFEDSLNNISGSSDAVSPRLGIVYQPIETISLYASYSQSFNPSVSQDADNNLLEPEQGEGFEVGIKTELLEGKLFASLGYFDITRQNVATANPVILGASVATGEERSRGVEFDLRGEILPGWNLIASYSYIDAEVTEDNTISVGNELPGVPRNSANFWTTYEIQSGDLEGLGFGIGLNFAGERAGDRDNTFEVDSYLLTNAAVFYQRDNWRAALNFRNIFDVEYIQGTSFSTTSSIEAGRPFTVVGSVSVRF